MANLTPIGGKERMRGWRWTEEMRSLDVMT